MNVLDLFSGIGGFSLGLERAGFRTSAFCEIDPFCRQVLARHWPGVTIHDDIRKLDGTQYAGAIDVVCGGYPCQPFSSAGRQLGEADPRHFWPEMHRIIREASPRWVIAENVRGHVSSMTGHQVALHLGDSKAVLPTLPDDSVHSIVTDPPYELGFMGKKWDASGVAYDVSLWRECLRVLKPGGHLLAFGGSRTYHRMASAIEDAGFEIRDQIQWLYGSGFPKSHNLDGEWKGWGSALKPAHEPIVVARKPLIGSIAENVRKYGTGALNIDGCRVGTAGGTTRGENKSNAGKARNTLHGGNFGIEELNAGRWPANIIHDGSEEVVAAFPDAPGQQGDLIGHSKDRKSKGIFGDMGAARDAIARRDSGSAARLFYCAKASRKDREEGLTGMPLSEGGMRSETSGQHITRRDGGAPGLVQNHHPTVKPTELMRYLCRLVTPPGGVVLDPFMGSGTTGKAAVLEGFRFVGIEREADYFEIAKARIEHAGGESRVEAVRATEVAKQEEAQQDLFDFTAA